MKNNTKSNGKRFVYLAAAISALGGMLFGYDIGVISGAILFITKQFALSPEMEEVVVSSVLLGCLTGAIVGGFLSDRYGRRRLLLITAVVFILGAVGAALSPDTVWLIVARFFAGTAIGVASFVAPLYISEIAPVAIRGKLVSLNQLAITRHCYFLGITMPCRGTGLALDVCNGGDSCGSIWNWIDAHSEQPAMARKPRTPGSSPHRDETAPITGTG